MQSFDWAKGATHPVLDYERKFGPLPAGLLKIASRLTVGTAGRLVADVTEALRLGKPITDWSIYGDRSHRPSPETPS